MSFHGGYATIEEAWGPGVQMGATVPPNIYQDATYQQQVLNSSSSMGIVPREPQVMNASLVKGYLAQLAHDSGPMAVRALLPPGFLAWLHRRCRAEEDDHRASSGRGGAGGLLEVLQDPETLFFLVVAVFAVMVFNDAV